VAGYEEKHAKAKALLGQIDDALLTELGVSAGPTTKPDSNPNVPQWPA
jgi:hypothetical protein